MAKKLTIKFVRDQFEADGYTLLAEEYVNSKSYLEYICPKGHKGKMIWNSWQRKHRCKICGNSLTVNKRRLTIEFIKEELKKEDYILLTKNYINNQQKLEYICPKGHFGSITWVNWRQRHRCAKCAGLKKLTIEFIRDQFKFNKCNLLTTVYKNAFQKLEYICPKGHTSFITWNNWNQGQRCLECSGKKKLTIEYIREDFEKSSYKLLTIVYINAFQKLEYVCPEGHRGSIQWNSWQQGQRCRQCYLESNKGSGNPNWNSNLTDEEREAQGRSPQCKIWSKQIKERDNHICRVCGQCGGNLESHHLESYNSTPELRIELSNGICLCKSCHGAFHNKYGRGNNTRKQFEEFCGMVIA